MFYRWPPSQNKKIDQIVRWSASETAPLIVFHPDISFDPLPNSHIQQHMIDRYLPGMRWDNDDYEREMKKYIPSGDEEIPIVHEVIEVRNSFFEYLEDFLSGIESARKVPKGAWLWDDTGYWAAKSGKLCYMGLNENTAKALWNRSQILEMCFVLITPNSLMSIELDKKEPNSFIIDAYYNNRFSAFPDLIEATHKALETIGNWSTLSIEKKDNSDLFGAWSLDTQKTNPQIKDLFTINPERVIPVTNHFIHGKRHYNSVVIENNFFADKKSQILPEGYAIARLRGAHWDDDDFSSEKNYYLFSSEIYKLRKCVLVDISLEQHYAKDDSEDSFESDMLDGLSSDSLDRLFL